MEPGTRIDPEVMRAIRLASRALASRERSRAWLELRLNAAGFEPDITTQALDWLEQNGLQSDARVAGSAAEGYVGRERLRERLRRAGLDEGTIASVLASRTDADELQRATLALRERFRPKGDASDPPRAYRKLLSLGFDSDVASAAVEAWLAELPS